MLGLIQVALASISIQVTFNKIDFFSDIGTIYRHCQLEPEILCVVCCPQCFKEYSMGIILLWCTWQCSPWSKPCGAILYVTQHTCNGGIKQIPKYLYTLQLFNSWLTFLLSQPQIDDYLHQTFAKLQNPSNPTACMHDIYDSPAWYSFCHSLLRWVYEQAFTKFTSLRAFYEFLEVLSKYLYWLYQR